MGPLLNFKAKTEKGDKGVWVYGWFTKTKVDNLIVPVLQNYKEWDTGDYIESTPIDGDTLCQETGRPDEKGSMIYVNDILNHPDNENINYLVQYDELYGIIAYSDYESETIYLDEFKNCIRVGNIFD